MKEYPKYSVLMSVYYKEKADWFDNSIKSMFNQTLRPDEFILVEDGKLTEELNLVVEKYKKKYPKIFKVITLEKNIGLGPALKIGIENCSNEFIVRMDSDDYSSPERVKEQLKMFKQDENLDIVGTNVSEFIDSIDNIVCDVILPETNEQIIKFSKKRNPFRHPSILFKKSAVLNAGNYREYYLCEDYDMWIRMIRSGCKCYNIQDVYVYMRINENFYKRRGGIKYLKSILKFKKEQLNNGYFTRIEYMKSAVPHIIVCLLPNILRDWIYINMLRKGANSNEKN